VLRAVTSVSAQLMRSRASVLALRVATFVQHHVWMVFNAKAILWLAPATYPVVNFVVVSARSRAHFYRAALGIARCVCTMMRQPATHHRSQSCSWLHATS
jgi:hypothetical protein